MTSENQNDDETAMAGPSSDQHITGKPETGQSIVDAPPTSTTPAEGSSNKGINTTHANRETE